MLKHFSNVAWKYVTKIFSLLEICLKINVFTLNVHACFVTKSRISCNSNKACLSDISSLPLSAHVLFDFSQRSSWKDHLHYYPVQMLSVFVQGVKI